MSRATSKPKRVFHPAQRQAYEIGCGIDVVELSRFEQALKRNGRAFLERVFTTQEQIYASARLKSVAHLAARFAAKEAVVKAMAQVDPDHPMTLRQIEIFNDALGRPHVKLHGSSTARVKIHISLSHAETLAIASALVLK